MLPLGVVNVSPVKAQALYLRKVFFCGVTVLPQGSVTVVLPLYQCWRACGTCIGWPGTLSTRLVMAPLFDKEMINGIPLCTAITEPTVQSPRTPRSHLLLRAKGPLAPKGEA